MEDPKDLIRTFLGRQAPDRANPPA